MLVEDNVDVCLVQPSFDRRPASVPVIVKLDILIGKTMFDMRWRSSQVQTRQVQVDQELAYPNFRPACFYIEDNRECNTPIDTLLSIML